MRILLASSSSGSHGGGEIALLYMGEALTQLGHTVALWVSDHERMSRLAERFSQFGEVIRAPYVNTYDLMGRSLSSYLHRRNKSVAIQSWRSWNPDVIHINKQNLEDGLDLVKAAKVCAIPSVCFIHITQSAKYLRASNAIYRDAIARHALKRYEGPFITAGDVRRDDLIRFAELQPERVHCIYNGTADPLPDLNPKWREQHRDRLGIRDGEVLITMTARLTGQKNPTRFLEVAQQLHETVPNARFLWIGGGDLELYWKTEIAKRSMDGYVTRLDWQDNVRPWLAASDAYLHTAAFEGMPFAIIEAMSMGLPCFLTDEMIDQISIFKNSNLGRVDADPCLLTSQILDSNLLSAMGQHSRSLYEREFRAPSIAAKYVGVYEGLLAEHSGVITAPSALAAAL